MEAAADPNSAVDAHEAEQKMLQESKKAGAAAFEFDPDASPEQKAAQLREVGTGRVSREALDTNANRLNRGRNSNVLTGSTRLQL